MSVAFVKEESAEAASETVIGERPVSPYPNLVTEAGFRQLENNLQVAIAACEAAEKLEDINERRRQSALPLRDARYFAARVRSARVVEAPTSNEVVAFGTTVTFQRNDGRVQTYRIVGEDEADPSSGTVSHSSPLMRSMMGKSVGETVGTGQQEIEIVAIAIGQPN